MKKLQKKGTLTELLQTPCKMDVLNARYHFLRPAVAHHSTKLSSLSTHWTAIYDNNKKKQPENIIVIIQ